MSDYRENNNIEKKLQSLIKDGNYEESEKILIDYEIELLSMKSVVFMMQYRFDEAEEILKKGLKISNNNFDLNYNLAYLYEVTGRYSTAINKYIEAKKECNDKKLNEKIDAHINEIKCEHLDGPLVSVCMPVYNDERSIEKAVRSVINQTYQNLEVIICDNNSEDNTYYLLEKINDHRIKLLKNNQNIGFIQNSNKVLKSAKGEYIVTLHGDDCYSSNYIENVVRIFKDNISVGIIHFVTADTKKIYFNNFSYIVSSDYYSHIASCNCMPSPTETAFRREALLNSSYYCNQYWSAEVRLSLEVAKQGFDAYIEDKYLFQRYGGEDNDSVQIDKQILKFKNLFQFYTEFKNDKNISMNSKNDLKNNIIKNFILLYKLKKTNYECKEEFDNAKKLLRSDIELYDLAFDYIFN